MRDDFYAFVLLAVAMSLAQALDGTLVTSIDGVSNADGNIFEIAAKANPVTVERIDVHLAAKTGPIEIWFYPGTATPIYNSLYQQALYVDDVTGNGHGAITPLPDLTNPIVIPAGETYTLYVTGADSEAHDMYYSTGTGLGQVYASDDNLEIREGYVSGYPFRGSASPRQWNGVLYYSVPDSGSTPITSSPVSTPVASFTPEPTSLTTSHPTMTPPTNSPSPNPTTASSGSPSASPSVKPTAESTSEQSPSTSRPTPSSTTNIVIISDITGMPTSKPTPIPSRLPTLEPTTEMPTKGILPRPTPSSSSVLQVWSCLLLLVSAVIVLFD